MKKSVLLVISLLVLGVLVYFYQKNKIPDNPKYQIIVEGKADNVYMSTIVELAREQDKIAFRYAVERANSDIPIHRQASAEALGYYDHSKAASLLKQLALDTDLSVRQRAVQAINYVASAERAEILQELMNNKSLTPQDLIQISAAVLFAVKDNKTRELAIQNLYKYLGPDQDPKNRVLAYGDLLSRAGQHPPVKEYVKNLFAKEKDPACLATVVRYYAPEKPAWIKEWFEKQDSNQDLFLQIALVENLHHYCPKNRKAIFNNSFKIKTPPTEKRLRLTMLSELKFFSSDFARAGIAQLNIKPTEEYLQNELSELRLMIQENKLRDFCAL